MPYIRDRVIVLKKEPYREHDRCYYMYGREYGLLTAVARGACLPKSKQAGHLEPFSESEVMIARGVAFDKLAVARLIHFPAKIDRSFLPSMFLIRGICDMLITLTRPGISDDRIFYLLIDLIRASEIATPFNRDILELLYQITLLRLLGFLGFATPIIEIVKSSDYFSLVNAVAVMSLTDIAKIGSFDSRVLQIISEYVQGLLEQSPLESAPSPILMV
ncbi:MAG: recombination protein O N-terminal domain-containing protein [Patescibacteria group bacterium]